MCLIVQIYIGVLQRRAKIRILLVQCYRLIRITKSTGGFEVRTSLHARAVNCMQVLEFVTRSTLSKEYLKCSTLMVPYFLCHQNYYKNALSTFKTTTAAKKETKECSRFSACKRK